MERWRDEEVRLTQEQWREEKARKITIEIERGGVRWSGTTEGREREWERDGEMEREGMIETDSGTMEERESGKDIAIERARCETDSGLVISLPVPQKGLVLPLSLLVLLLKVCPPLSHLLLHFTTQSSLVFNLVGGESGGRGRERKREGGRGRERGREGGREGVREGGKECGKERVSE